MTVNWMHSYIKLTEFLGQMLGPDYEVVLHDVNDKDHSVIAIANGHISGRHVGAPLTATALQTIASRSYENEAFRSNYTGVANNGKLLRSSTFYIKDAQQNLVGMLCINFDDSRYRDLSNTVLRLCHPDNFVAHHFAFDAQKVPTTPHAPLSEETESFQSSLNELTDELLDQTLPDQSSLSTLRKKDRLQLIDRLNKKGFFLLKGATRKIAGKMQCSQATIYRHLKRLNHHQDDSKSST